MRLRMGDLEISSDDIVPWGNIPASFTASGGDLTPAISISGVPDGAVELAVICHDPDAPLPRGFTHWVVYGVPSAVRDLDLRATGVRQGPNGLGEAAWTGPNPPAGHGRHHYYFWAYALGRHVRGEPSREQFLDEYADDVIEQARLVGIFEQ